MAYTSPTKTNVRVAAAPASRLPRVGRRPQHPFNVITKPYQIQPVGIMPVLPGETLKNIMLQAQVWSDPLAVGMKNIGWWCEYHVFYVAHQHLAGWDTSTTGIAYELADMFVSNGNLNAFQDADGNAWTYCYPGAVDFLLEGTKRVVEEYFRDEGEAWNVATLDGVPQAQIYSKGRSDVFEHLTDNAAYADRDEAVPANMSDLELAWLEWASLRDGGQIDMDYDDWMRTYGSAVTTDRVEDAVQRHRPEDIAYLREFSYPANTVEPSTGEPSTAAGWNVRRRMDRRVFFREPGWLMFYNVIKPKVYLGNQQGTLSGAMQSRATWLPPVLGGMEDQGHLMFGNATGPLKGVTDTPNVDYWVDIKDLLQHGEQFINYATPASGATGVPFVDLPSATLSRRYAGSTDIMAMFADTTNGRFRQDGMISLTIQGRVASGNRSLVLGSGGMLQR